MGETRKIAKNIAEPIRVYTVGAGVPAQAKTAMEPKPPAPKKRSALAPLAAGIAAMLIPLAGVANDSSQDYFADGIAENFTTDLSRLSGSFVIARNIAFTFEGENVDAKEIGKEVGVRNVPGSVQRDQSRVRVRAQAPTDALGAKSTEALDASKETELTNLKVGIVGSIDNLSVSDEEKGVFKLYVDNFLDRNRDRMDLPKLSDAEKRDTLKAVQELLAATTSVSGETRNNVLAAEGILYHAANPDTLSQGKSGMCASIAIGYSLFFVKPSLAASMIASALLDETGWKNRREGDTAAKITVDSSSIKLNSTNEQEDRPPWKQDLYHGLLRRSYASHVLGEAVFNDIGQHLRPALTFSESKPDDPSRGVLYGITWNDKSSGGEVSMMDDEIGGGMGRGVVDPGGGPTAWQVGEEMSRLLGVQNAALQSDEYAYDGKDKMGLDHKLYHYAKADDVDRVRPEGASNNSVTYVSDDRTAFKTLLHDRLQNGPVIAQVGEHFIHPPNQTAVPDHFVAVVAMHGDDVIVHNTATAERKRSRLQIC